MASNRNQNGEFTFATSPTIARGRNGLPRIHTEKKKDDEVCHDDSAPPVKVQTLDELHSLQRKKSAPTTPIKGTQGAFGALSEEERQKQQLQSIRFPIYIHMSPYYYYYFGAMKMVKDYCKI